jgi:hypothetical protein
VLYLDPARAAVGPLPAEALVLPTDSRFVIGLEVKRFVASPFYKRLAPEMRPDAMRELEEKTGLNPERDLDRIVIAGRGPHTGPPLALVLGQFDRQKLSRTIETERKDRVTWKDVQGTTVYLFREGEKSATAVAFLDDRALLIGSAEGVETAIGNRVRGTPGLRGNASLTGLLEKLKPGAAFWMVGDQSLLANLPRSMAGPGGGDTQVTLPALRSLTVTGELDPLLAISVTGEAPDAAAATNLADVVRGFVALAALQAGQKPELKDLASAISVATEENRVLVNARISYETLEALQPRKAAAGPGVITP